MNAARHAEVSISSSSLVRASEKADHANAVADTDFPKLTGRELDVLGLIAEGHRSQAVANRLFVSKRTVDFHLRNIYQKWRVTNRMQAVQIATARGLLTLSATH